MSSKSALKINGIYQEKNQGNCAIALRKGLLKSWDKTKQQNLGLINWESNSEHVHSERDKHVRNCLQGEVEADTAVT